MIPQHGTLEISRSRLAHNVALFRRHIGEETLICAALKADAYGHGSDLLAPLLMDAGVSWCGVYSFEELAAQARHPWQSVLILSPLVLHADVQAELKPRLRDGLKRNVRVTLADAASARRLAAFARENLDRDIFIHIQIDTGLTRLGIDPRAAQDLASLVADLPGLRLEGLYAHFSHGDVPGHESLLLQTAILQSAAETLRKSHPKLMVHLQNSGGTWNLEPPGVLGLDMVRLGIALYGLQPSTDHPIAGLQPVARLTAPILAIHHTPPGTGVGYGHTFITRRPSLLAIVPVGYADGYPRLLSNRSIAQIAGEEVPVIGRVSMDQIILDITELPKVQVGDTVTVISWDPAAKNSLDQMAAAIGTIGYELATHLGARLKRVLVD